MGRAEDVICAALRGENPRWPTELGDEFVSLFLARTAYHGVQALLHERLEHQQAPKLDWPESVRSVLRDVAIFQAMWEIRHRELLRRVVSQLSAVGVSPVFFKGTALAYDVYPSAFLRTRGDSDFIINLAERDLVCNVLESAGFTCEAGPRGDLISHTAVYRRRDPSSGAHEIDVHWRISNTQFLAKLFSYWELAAASSPLPALGPSAKAAGRAHALALACMHRATHRKSPYFVDGAEYYGGDRLIWLYDIHLLLRSFSLVDRHAFLAIAQQKGLGRICLEGLEEASACFGAEIPEDLHEGLVRLGPNEPASSFLNGSLIKQYYQNFLAVEGFYNRLRLLGQMLFPPKSYMLSMYPQVKPNWLAWLYLRRAAVVIYHRFFRVQL